MGAKKLLALFDMFYVIFVIPIIIIICYYAPILQLKFDTADNTFSSIVVILTKLGTPGFAIVAIYALCVSVGLSLHRWNPDGAFYNPTRVAARNRHETAANFGFNPSMLYFIGFFGTLWALTFSFVFLLVGEPSSPDTANGTRDAAGPVEGSDIVLLLQRAGAALTSTIFGLAARRMFIVCWGPPPDGPNGGGGGGGGNGRSGDAHHSDASFPIPPSPPPPPSNDKSTSKSDNQANECVRDQEPNCFRRLWNAVSAQRRCVLRALSGR